MASSSKEQKRTVLEVVVELKELTKEQPWPQIAAYGFGRSGRLLSKQPLKQDAAKPHIGRATLPVEIGREQITVKVGPDVENVAELARHSLAVEKTIVKPREKVKLSMGILKPGWICWLKVPYLVTGKVEKQQGSGRSPICVGEVDIYDVDIGWCLLRLPPLIIERIRDSIIDIIVNPPPVDLPELPPRLHWDDDDWCGTGPKPPIPPTGIDISKRLAKLPPEWSFAKERFEAVGTARARMTEAMAQVKLGEKRAMLNSEAVKGVAISEILYSNTMQFRNLLIDHFSSFRFWLCWYPWIYWYWWPWCWWYSLEKLGTATLQPDGSFSKVVWLSVCRNDTPDLWFVVRQKVNGVERVIYARHPVPCNTYWNHPSGKPVTLVVTHPEAVVCRQDEPVDVTGPYVMPLGIYEDEWHRVHQAHIKPPAVADSACGLYNSSDPYGTRLDLRMQFHDGLRSLGANGVRYYRWSYRKHGTSNGWTHISTPITHRYITMVGGEYVIQTENLGPKSDVGNSLFEVPDPSKSWLANRDDLAFAIWHTAIWDAQQGRYVPQVGDGKYELRLEMFDKNGTKVKPAAAGFLYILMTAAVGVTDKNLHVEPDGSLIMNLHVDNADTVADIKSVALNGVKAKDCQFLEYEQNTDTVEIEHVAYHPNDFLDRYNLGVRRGISGTSVHSMSSTTPSLPAAPGVESVTVEKLLRQVGNKGPYTKCAFSIDLHTWPRTRDGHGRIRAYEAHDTSAFTLLEKTVGTSGGTP